MVKSGRDEDYKSEFDSEPNKLFSGNIPIDDSDILTTHITESGHEKEELSTGWLYHGKVVACSGYCGLKCSQPLWICTSCNHVECDYCIEDYTANNGRPVINIHNKCRRCGAEGKWEEFLRTGSPGINKIPNGWRKDLYVVFRYGDLHFTKLERIIYELKRIYQRFRYFNP